MQQQRRAIIRTHKWHRRLGHRDPEAILEAERQELTTGIKIHPCGIKAVCECCLEGKMSRKPFPKKAKQKSKAIMDLVHSDFCEPMNTKTPGGCRYFLTFIDDHSRYSWIYFLRNKSETVDCFDHYVQLMKTQHGWIPKILRSDQGGEYRNKGMGELCKEFGILQQFTTTYTSQQNGAVERRNRYLVEMSRRMLLAAKMGYRYGEEAVSTANFLQNVLPTRVKTRAVEYHDRLATLTKRVFSLSQVKTIFHVLTSSSRSDRTLTSAISM